MIVDVSDRADQLAALVLLTVLIIAVGGTCAHVAGQAGAAKIFVAEGSDRASATWVEAYRAALVVPKTHGRSRTGEC